MKLPVERLVFIDEFAVNTSMTRTHARAPRGERAEVSEPGHHGPNISVLSALSLSGVGAMMTIEGAVDTQVFDLYVEHFLVPELVNGDIVILDNVTFHYSQRAIRLIEAAGCAFRDNVNADSGATIVNDFGTCAGIRPALLQSSAALEVWTQTADHLLV